MSESRIGLVTLERGPCLGPCPVYKVTLRPDGRAVYKGREYAPRAGVYWGQMAPGDFERLASFIERCGFFGWNDRYAAELTDMPEYEITVRRGGSVKSVVQRGVDEPADFWVIASLIDAIAECVDWKLMVPPITSGRR